MKKWISKKIFIFVFGTLVLIVYDASGEKSGVWTQIQGPFGADVNCILVDENNQNTIYMGGINRFFISKNSGENWETYLIANNNGPWGAFQVTSIAKNYQTNELFVGGIIYGWKIFKSIDEGHKWKEYSIPITEGPHNGVYASLVDDRGNLWATTHPNGVFKSTDGGATWIQKNNGIATLSSKTLNFDKKKKTLYVGTYRGMFISRDYGESWQNIPSLGDYTIDAMDIKYDNSGEPELYAVSGYKQNFYSSQDGINFNLISNVGPHNTQDNPDSWWIRFADLVIDNSNPNKILLTNDPDGILMSLDKGYHWESINQGLLEFNTSGWIYCLAQNSSCFFASGYNKGMFKSQKDKIYWTDSSFGLNSLDIRSIAFSGDYQYFYAGSGGKGLFYSNVEGLINGNWSHSYVPIEPMDEITMIYCPKDVPNLVYFNIFEGYLFKSLDYGKTFKTLYGISTPWGYGRRFFVDPHDYNKIIFLRGDAILKTSDGGYTWHKNSIINLCFNCGNFNPFNSDHVIIGSTRIGAHGDIIAESASLYESINGGISWQKINYDFGDQINRVIFDDNQANLVYVGSSNGICKSIDGGISWSKISNYSPYDFILDPQNSQKLFLAGGDGFNILNTSTNTLRLISKGLFETIMPFQFVLNDPLNPDIIYASSHRGGIWKLSLAACPPLNFEGTKIINRSFSQKENMIVLKWQENPENGNIIKYKIYRVVNENNTLLAELGPSTFEYKERKPVNIATCVYAIVAQNDFGRESNPIYVTIQ